MLKQILIDTDVGSWANLVLTEHQKKTLEKENEFMAINCQCLGQGNNPISTMGTPYVSVPTQTIDSLESASASNSGVHLGPSGNQVN